MPSLEQVSKGSPKLFADGADAYADAFLGRRRRRRRVCTSVPWWAEGGKKGKTKEGVDHAKLDVRLISRSRSNLAVITIRPRHPLPCTLGVEIN